MEGRPLHNSWNAEALRNLDKFAAILLAKYTTASFPDARYNRLKNERLSSGMDSNRTSWRIAHVVSIVALSFVILVLFNGSPALHAVAQQQRPSAKSNGTATQREDIASLLREAASLLQAGKLDEAEPLVRHVVATAPSNADAHNLLGAILDQRGQTQAAE